MRNSFFFSKLAVASCLLSCETTRAMELTKNDFVDLAFFSLLWWLCLHSAAVVVRCKGVGLWMKKSILSHTHWYRQRWGIFPDFWMDFFERWGWAFVVVGGCFFFFEFLMGFFGSCSIMRGGLSTCWSDCSGRGDRGFKRSLGWIFYWGILLDQLSLSPLMILTFQRAHNRSIIRSVFFVSSCFSKGCYNATYSQDTRFKAFKRQTFLRSRISNFFSPLQIWG